MEKHDSDPSPVVIDAAPAASPAGGPRRGFTFAKLLRSRGGWALADQAVVSIGNFITALIVMRTLAVPDYGVFILLFGMLLFLNSLHSSLVTYPLSVRGASSELSDLRGFAGHSLVFTFVLMLPLSIGVIVIALLEHRAALIPWAVVAMVLWQGQETVRRGILAHLRHREAVVGDALSYLGQAAMIFTLRYRGLLTLETVFIAIAVTSFIGLLIQTWQLKPLLSLIRRDISRLASEHWSLGQWVLLVNVITLVTVQAMPWTLNYFYGTAEVAKLGVLAQVMGLTNPIIISIAGLVVPAVAAARGRSNQGVHAAKRVAFMYGLQGATLLVPYYLAVILLPELVLRLFTKNNPAYTGLTTPLRLFVLTYAIIFPAQVMQALFNGLSRARSAFIAQCAFSIATLAFSLPLAAIYGLKGAVWSGALPAAVYVAASAVMLRKTNDAEPRGFEVVSMKDSPQGSRATPEGAAA